MFLQRQYVFLNRFLDDDTGTSTPEYSIVIIAAVTLALSLVAAMRSETVRQTVAEMVQKALNVSP